MPRVEGTERLALERAAVWELLNDPDMLAASIPGCRGFERDGDAEHRYRTAIKVAVGAVTGVYEGTVEYRDVVAPERCTIVVSGKGDKGTIEGSGAITLNADGQATEVGYRGEFKLTGPVAGVGQRLAPGVSRKMIVETLRNLERRGQGQATAKEEEPREAPAVEGSEARPTQASADAAQRSPGRPAAGDDAFRPFSVSPGVAFTVGLVIGFVIAALLFAVL